MKNNPCKICRRAGQKLFLKGEKCFSPKCPLIRKPYAPGNKKKRRGGTISEYKKELIEKQKMRAWYGLSERQFKIYIKDSLKKRGQGEDASLRLIKKLEKRLDNVVFRLGLATSRKQARQIISHGSFLVNGKPVNIPSYQVKKGDVIAVKEQKKTKTFFKNISSVIKKFQPVSWLKLDKAKLSGEVIGEPSLEDANVPAEIHLIFEFYSR